MKKRINEEAVTFIASKGVLTDSRVRSVLFKANNGDLDVEIELYDSLRRKWAIYLKKVFEFSFFFTKDYTFYELEEGKIGNVQNGFYLSLDPDMTYSEFSESDQDYFLFELITLEGPE